MSHAASWERHRYLYTDDFGRDCFVETNDYIAEAGGLERVPQNRHGVPSRGNIHVRHLKVRAVKPEKDGRKSYKEIPVQETNPLWTGPIGRVILVAGQEMEIIAKIDEKEYGRAGAAAQRRALKEQKRREALSKDCSHCA